MSLINSGSLVPRKSMVNAFEVMFEDFEKSLNSFWNDPFFNDSISLRQERGFPKLNIMDTDKAYLIEAAVPSLKREDINIEVSDNAIKIEYTKKEETQKFNYLLRELSFRGFSRVIPFPESIKEEEVKAKIEDGVLKITVPKNSTSTIKTKKVCVE